VPALHDYIEYIDFKEIYSMRWKEEEIKKRGKLAQESEEKQCRLELDRLTILKSCVSFFEKLRHANDKLPHMLRLEYRKGYPYEYLGIFCLAISNNPPIIRSDGNKCGDFIISYNINMERLYMITQKEKYIYFSSPWVSRFYWIDENNIDILFRNICTGKMIDEGLYPFQKRRGVFDKL